MEKKVEWRKLYTLQDTNLGGTYLHYGEEVRGYVYMVKMTGRWFFEGYAKNEEFGERIFGGEGWTIDECRAKRMAEIAAGLVCD